MQKISQYIKPTVFLGSIIGLILGILLVIPVIQIFVIFIFFGVGAIVTVMFKKNGFVKDMGTQEGVIIGGISGFMSVVLASVSFLIIALLFGTIFNGVYGMIRPFFMSFGSFIFMLFFIFCIAFMNMIFNMGAALLVISLYNGMIKKDEQPKFNVENRR